MRPPALLVAFALAALPLGVGAARAGDQDIRVSPLVRDGDVLVSFSAPRAITSELRDAIRSGLVVTFTYDIALRQRAFLWFDRTHARLVLAVSVRYDNLTRTYEVSRMTDGKVVWSQTTASEDDVRAWVTGADPFRVTGGSALEPNAEYELVVRASISPRRAWSLWPWGRDDATGRATFTYIR